MPRGAAPAVFTLVPLSLDPIKVKHGQPEGRPGLKITHNFEV